MNKHTTKQLSWIGEGVEKGRMSDGRDEKKRKWGRVDKGEGRGETTEGWEVRGGKTATQKNLVRAMAAARSECRYNPRH